jgi:hypothetical protein
MSPTSEISPGNSHHLPTAPTTKFLQELRLCKGRVAGRPWSAGGDVRRQKPAL